MRSPHRSAGDVVTFIVSNSGYSTVIVSPVEAFSIVTLA